MNPEQFLNDIERIENQLIQRIKTGLSKGFTNVELAELSAQIDFFEELKRLGYTESLSKYIEGYDEIAKNILETARSRGVNLATVNYQDLEILKLVKAEELLGKAQLYSRQLKTQLFNNIVAGTPINEIVSILQTEVPLRDNQLTAAVTTGINEYNRSATATVYKDSPEQRFILVGPDDIRTRASCDAVLAYQPTEGFTIKQINEGAWTNIVKRHAKEFAKTRSELEQALKLPYTFTNCGGFNCRHDPRPA